MISESPQENEKPNMNNFYFYLPGGFYRGQKSDPESLRIMKTIDELLRNDFPKLDVAGIYKIICKSVKKIAKTTTFFLKTGGSYEELMKNLKKEYEDQEKAREELRPLFDKLIEMGFDPELLMR